MKYWRWTVGLSLLWTAVAVISLATFVRQENGKIRDLAQLEAHASFEKDLLYRAWSAGHGGLYAPATETTTPNPYLEDTPERDIVTPSGRKLTLINPAYMTRQVHELGLKKSGVQGHITSLNPIRPQNAADSWETAALHAFESGKAEVWSVEQVNDKSYLRLMKPLFVEKACLKCHAKQGYKVGDVRGGISVSVPMTPYLAIAGSAANNYRIQHGIAWGLGILILVSVSVALERSGRNRANSMCALRESERNLAEAQKQTHVGSFEYDFIGNRLKWSDEMLRIHGIAREDFHGAPEDFLNMIQPEDRPRIDKIRLQALMPGNDPQDVEYRIRRPDGTIRFVRMLFETFFDEKNNPIRRLGTVQDNTDRRISEERYAAVLNATMDGFIMLDISGRIVDCNHTFCAMSGYSERELLSATVSEILKDKTPAATEELLKEIVKTGSARFVTPHIRKDGSVFTAEASVTFLSHDGGRFVCFIRDVTEHIRAEEAMIESEANLRQAQAVALLGHYVFNIPSGTWTSSPGLDNVFGIEAGFVKNIEGWLAIVHPDDRDEMSAYLRNHVIGEKKPFDREYRIIRKSDRAMRWVHGKGDLKIAPDGTPQTMFGIIQDISFNKEVQERNSVLQNQLQQAQKMEAVGRLAGGVAHDFNNLLTGISGYTELLLSGVREGNPLRSDLVEIKKAADRAASLTAQLLAFSRRQVISPRIIDLNKLLEEATKMLRRLIGEDVDMIFSPGRDVGKVKVDPNQIEQVLINLSINARDAMPAGGILTIETANVVIDEKHIAEQPESRPGSYVLITVKDNGCGMSPEVLEHLFEPFFTTKEKDKGTGLGLSMIYGIVRQNNGFIDVSSEVGLGTTFKVYLPMVEGEVEQVRKPKMDEVPRGTETILLIEDEAMVRTLAQKVLEQQGYRVLAVERGGNALVKAEEKSVEIDLLLTDVIMPDMTGRQIYERISQLRPGLRVLYMSGYPEHAISHHGILEEGTNFIQKPFSVKDLARKVREVLQERA